MDLKLVFVAAVVVELVENSIVGVRLGVVVAVVPAAAAVAAGVVAAVVVVRDTVDYDLVEGEVRVPRVAKVASAVEVHGDIVLDYAIVGVEKRNSMSVEVQRVRSSHFHNRNSRSQRPRLWMVGLEGKRMEAVRHIAG